MCITQSVPEFTIYPAIDLRNGYVVRLQQGDPHRQTTFSSDPSAIAYHWLDKGARWLHVINLDGALGNIDSSNRKALDQILKVAQTYDASVQFGGGLRSERSISTVLDLGVRRVVLGTVIVKQPVIVSQALMRWGPEYIAVGLDARYGELMVEGWRTETGFTAIELAKKYRAEGVKWAIFTDIDRDGLKAGVNLKRTLALAKESGLAVIASGGVKNQEDVRKIKECGLAGVIIGRALYDGAVNLKDVLC